MSRVNNMLEGRDAFQRDLDRLERWVCVNLIKFNKAKREVLHMGRGTPKDKYRVGEEWIESDSAEKDLGVLMDERLDRSQQCAPAAQKSSCILGCIKTSVVPGSTEVICLRLHSLETPPGLLHPSLRPPA
ncbi:rna-directed dna polymerase from mobile element jockey-like [Pitangus sulphuratus]|nr:rna-directed dna polymerase from mobile element jockey-like [Pitangus sulphuratus]